MKDGMKLIDISTVQNCEKYPDNICVEALAIYVKAKNKTSDPKQEQKYFNQDTSIFGSDPQVDFNKHLAAHKNRAERNLCAMDNQPSLLASAGVWDGGDR